MNKHQKLAIIIAPFLAIGGYVATDYYQQYKSRAELQHKAGRMQLQGECKLPEHPCTFTINDLRITLQRDTQESNELSLTANYPLDGVTLAFGQLPPVKMHHGKDQQHWQTQMPASLNGGLRLVTSVQKIFYFAEIAETTK